MVTSSPASCPGCLRLQDEQEPAKEENHQHERRDGQREEGQQQVVEPENKSTHVVGLSFV